ncbi:MAG: hypothetical protein QGG40_02875 [Myxococcota bacterium]|nr:hypothetical protein [Myxococcota bacterium]
MIWTWLMMLACQGGGDDTGPGYDCAGSGDPTLTIGQGQGSTFVELETGDTVGLDVAPQGGFGVPIRAQTTGLVADEAVDVLLVTEIDGVEVGSFLNQGTNLYCQDDQTGLLWGVVVGFDADVYQTNEDLLELNGQSVDLVVTAYDTDGDEAEGRVTVTVEVGG